MTPPSPDVWDETLLTAVVAAMAAAPSIAGLAGTDATGAPVAVYLPARQLSGLALGTGGLEVHLIAKEHPVRAAAEAHALVATLTADRCAVHVVVEDVVADVLPAWDDALPA